MKIYAIRDRLIDYWGQPFVGPDNGAVKQAVARTVNSGDVTSDIANAPHHFEIHQLGYVTEEGHLVAERSFVCDCASLIRGSVRQAEASNGQGAETGNTAGTRHNGTGGGFEDRRGGGTEALQGPPSGPDTATDEVRRGTQGGYPPRGEG